MNITVTTVDVKYHTLMCDICRLQKEVKYMVKHMPKEFLSSRWLLVCSLECANMAVLRLLC